VRTFDLQEKWACILALNSVIPSFKGMYFSVHSAVQWPTKVNSGVCGGIVMEIPVA
jgi:hypothetical protein